MILEDGAHTDLSEQGVEVGREAVEHRTGVGEVARATQTIAGATEEMAASIAEVSQTSDTVVTVAQDALTAMQACVGDGQQARSAMQEIDTRTSQIADRVVVLERAISQIEVMATAIASISATFQPVKMCRRDAGLSRSDATSAAIWSMPAGSRR